MFPAGDVERRAPRLIRVPRELEVVALARHAGLEIADPAPGVEPVMERPDHRPVRQRQDGGRDSREQEPAATVKHYSITWSARWSSDAGIARPRAFAVLRLMTSSNLVGCSIGRSPGLA